MLGRGADLPPFAYHRRRSQDLSRLRVHGDEDSRLAACGLDSLGKEAFGRELEGAVDRQHDVAAQDRRLDLVLAAGNRGTPGSGLDAQLARCSGEHVVVHVLQPADPRVVDIGPPEDGDRRVLAGTHPGAFLDREDARQVQVECGLSDILGDLSIHVDEGATIGEPLLEGLDVGVHDLGKGPGSADRVFDESGVGGDGLERHRECEVHAVAVEDGTPCRREVNDADALSRSMGKVAIGLEDLE